MRKLWMIAAVAAVSACGGGGGGGGGSDAGSGNGGGGSGSSAFSNWMIPQDEVVDGGPGRDGIPAINNPIYAPINQTPGEPDDLIIVMKDGVGVKAIPHDIVDWHEIVNDTLAGEPVVMSYCPLTGSALLWKASPTASDPTFGVSGLLYNANLILFDRETDSHWAQMRIQSVQGTRSGEVPESLALLETTRATLEAMYPGAVMLSRSTGFSRDYDRYPYRDYRTSSELLFGVNPYDRRLQEKVRVLGVRINDVARAYQIDQFEAGIEVINDTLDGEPVVVVGSSARNFAIAFKRTLTDGTVLTFSAPTDPLPSVMSDDEGNTWDAFGEALTGTRTAERLALVRSHVAFWFAWAAFNPDSEIAN